MLYGGGKGGVVIVLIVVGLLLDVSEDILLYVNLLVCAPFWIAQGPQKCPSNLFVLERERGKEVVAMMWFG